MRKVLELVGEPPDHIGLAYDTWAPVAEDGKLRDEDRLRWLRHLSGRHISPDYQYTFNRWERSLALPGHRTFKLRLASRLLVGQGNSSATGVGLTVHHTWGVPVIPGSALKGLVAHYVDAVYGPDDPDLPPWEQPNNEQRQRAQYQGVTWKGNRIHRGPGDVYRALFGAPEAEMDGVMRQHDLEAGASCGLVTFHDALYVPGSVLGDRPYAVDVLTVHQKEYYRSSGRQRHWPSDYDSPNPVAFLTVRPGVQFLFALSGPPDWSALAERFLREALTQWGVGGKTNAGYGLFIPSEHSAGGGSAETRARVLIPKVGERVEAVLLGERTKKGGWKARHEASGLSGPVQNSGDVPADMAPGQRVQLVVASVSAREIAFRYPTAPPAARTGQGDATKKGER